MGNVKIGIDIDAKINNSINSQIDALEKKFNEVQSVANKGGFGEKIKADIQSARGEVAQLREDFNNIYSGFKNQKLDTKNFDDFVKSTQSSISELNKRVVAAEESVKKLETIFKASQNSNLFEKKLQSLQSQINGFVEQTQKGISTLIEFNKLVNNGTDIKVKGDTSDLKDTVEQTVSSFTFKDGGVKVPVTLDKSQLGKLKSSYDEIVGMLQTYAQNNPVDVTMRLFPLNTTKAGAKEVSDAVKNVQAQIASLPEGELKTSMNELYGNLEQQFQKALRLKIDVDLGETQASIKQRITELNNAVKEQGFTIYPDFDISDAESDKISAKLTELQEKLTLNVTSELKAMSDSMNALFSNTTSVEQWSNVFITSLTNIETKLNQVVPLINQLKVGVTSNNKSTNIKKNIPTDSDVNVLIEFTNAMKALRESLISQQTAELNIDITPLLDKLENVKATVSMVNTGIGHLQSTLANVKNTGGLQVAVEILQKIETVLGEINSKQSALDINVEPEVDVQSFLSEIQSQISQSSGVKIPVTLSIKNSESNDLRQILQDVDNANDLYKNIYNRLNSEAENIGDSLKKQIAVSLVSGLRNGMDSVSEMLRVGFEGTQFEPLTDQIIGDTETLDNIFKIANEVTIAFQKGLNKNIDITNIVSKVGDEISKLDETIKLPISVQEDSVDSFINDVQNLVNNSEIKIKAQLDVDQSLINENNIILNNSDNFVKDGNLTEELELAEDSASDLYTTLLNIVNLLNNEEFNNQGGESGILFNSRTQEYSENYGLNGFTSKIPNLYNSDYNLHTHPWGVNSFSAGDLETFAIDLQDNITHQILISLNGLLDLNLGKMSPENVSSIVNAYNNFYDEVVDNAKNSLTISDAYSSKEEYLDTIERKYSMLLESDTSDEMFEGNPLSQLGTALYEALAKQKDEIISNVVKQAESNLGDFETNDTWFIQLEREVDAYFYKLIQDKLSTLKLDESKNSGLPAVQQNKVLQGLQNYFNFQYGFADETVLDSIYDYKIENDPEYAQKIHGAINNKLRELVEKFGGELTEVSYDQIPSYLQSILNTSNGTSTSTGSTESETKALLSKKEVVEQLRAELNLTKKAAEELFNEQGYEKTNNRYQIEQSAVEELITSLKEKKQLEESSDTVPFTNVGDIEEEIEVNRELVDTLDKVDQERQDDTSNSVAEQSTTLAEKEAQSMSELYDKALKAAEAKEKFSEANKEVLESIVNSLSALNSEGEGFESLNKLINNLARNKDDRITDMVANLELLRDALSSPVDENSFIKAIQQIASQGERLSDLAAVLKASKIQLQNANDVVNTKELSNIDKAVEQYNRLYNAQIELAKIKPGTNAEKYIYYTQEVNEATLAIDNLKLSEEELATVTEQTSAKEMQAANAIAEAERKNQEAYQKSVESAENLQRKVVSLATSQLNNGKIMAESGDRIKEIISEANSMNTKIDPSGAIDGLKDLRSELENIISSAKQAGNYGQSFSQILSTRFKSLGAYLSTFTSFYKVVSYIKQTISSVQELNTQMIELAKVSDQSIEEIKADFNSYAETAKDLGSTISDTISATSDWARMGYNIPDSQELARVALLYKNVGDGIDIATANESLISTLQGYQMTADEAEHIVDVFNEVSNNFAISSGGIGEALQRSAASLNAANTSLEKSVALVTSANTVLQNPESVGTVFKTLSARIRGAKTDLEELGEEEDEFTQSTSKLQGLVKGLTGFDILEDDKETFKDIYDILIGIGEKWSDLTDVERASLGEALAGKRNSNALYAILDNIETLESAYETAENSAGSAMREQENYEKGIEYSVNRAKAALEELANDALSSDLLKGFIDTGTEGIELLDNIIDKIGILKTAIIGIVTVVGSQKLG